MKKWFAVLFVSFMSVTVFAQVDPHSSQKKGQQGATKGLESVLKIVSETTGSPLSGDFHAVEAALERKVVQTVEAPQNQKDIPPQKAQQGQTGCPHGDGLQDMEKAAPTVYPSYYADEKTYKNCEGVNVCKVWVEEQIQKDNHFLVLSATISMPDFHNQRLEVTYTTATENEKQKIVFEENFGNWKQVK